MSMLDKIDSTFLSQFSLQEKKALCEEIRQFLIDSVSKTGGHLGSNLGVVELTVALHSILDTRKDKLIWDVGHQCYTHKILTGRKDEFPTLRQYKGMSGFPKMSESIHDHFDTGHASTSISVASGYALSNRLRGDDSSVFAVIGDGALTGGMAFEALNFIGGERLNVKIILNDNEMSISKNVGGLFNTLRVSRNYQQLKINTKKGLSSLPFGNSIANLISRFKGAIKAGIYRFGMIFEQMGITYIGPIDGHDLSQLTDAVSRSKRFDGPVIIHVKTKKGKGYKFSEENPLEYHGVGKFDTMSLILPKVPNDYSSIVGNKLISMASQDKNIVVISAAMIEGTGLSDFAKKYPNRCLDVGIAEQQAVTMASSMAVSGLRPFVCIYSTFLQRAFDQIVHDVAINSLPVTFCIDRAGLVGADGATHHGIFDISYLSLIPNMTIISPCDKEELENAIEQSLSIDGPVAIRYPRGAYTSVNESIPLKLQLLKEGSSDGECIITTGSMVSNALQIAEKIPEISVIKVPIIKPVNSEELIKIISEIYSIDFQNLSSKKSSDGSFDRIIEEILKRGINKKVYTLEEHTLRGGFGEIIESALGLAFNKLGIKDHFVEHGDNSLLLKEMELDAGSIAQRIINDRKSKA